MVLYWGIKTLLLQKTLTFGAIAGIAFSFFLALFFASVWLGETEQIVAYPKKMDADLWVMQQGVSNMHMATSFVWDWKADAIQSLPDVEKVTPFIYLNSVINVGKNKLFGFTVGLSKPSDRSGPWEISSGRTLRAPNEIIVPDAMASIYGLKLQDTARIIDKDYTIVGFSSGTYSSANPIFFVLQENLEKSMSSQGTYSYFLVDLVAGSDVAEVRKKIIEKVDSVNVLTQQEFVANDYAMAKQMGAETILIMTLICSSLVALIIGYSSYTLVLRKKREIAIIKAIGAKNIPLLAVIFMQSTTVTLIAYLIAVVLLFSALYWLPVTAPQITLKIAPMLVVKPVLFALIVALLGAAYPALQLIKLDPALAYKGR